MKAKHMTDPHREFYRDQKNQPYELLTVSSPNGDNTSHLYTLRQLFGDEDTITYNKDVFETQFTPCTQASLFETEDDDEYDKMLHRVGIGYICPFCGGYLRWNSDFMTSEVRGMGHCYVKITDDKYIKENEAEFRDHGMLIDVESVEAEEAKFQETGDYQYAYVKCNGEYYVADDPVIGIYTSMNCGKEFEVQDCLISDEAEYPFFNKDND